MSNKKEEIISGKELEALQGELEDFRKENPSDKVWWTGRVGIYGEHLFSFDKKKIYNLFEDYPQNLTPEEKEIFDKENPYWVEFFKVDK